LIRIVSNRFRDFSRPQPPPLSFPSSFSSNRLSLILLPFTFLWPALPHTTQILNARVTFPPSDVDFPGRFQLGFDAETFRSIPIPPLHIESQAYARLSEGVGIPAVSWLT
jgi:hypothetical protein